MRLLRFLLFASALLLLMLIVSPSPSPGAKAVTPKAPAVSTRAADLLRKMSDYLTGLQQFQFHAEISREVILPEDQHIDVLQAADVLVQRPNKLHVDVMRANRDRQFIYNGKTLTVYSPTRKYYAVAPAPPTIDQLLDTALSDYGISFPLGDLLYANVYQTLLPDVQSGVYIGPSIVNGDYTQQLTFRQKDLDWQIWIQDGAMPVPRRIVITDRGEPGAPQFVATLTRWNVAPTFSEDIFTFTPPADAKQIKFMRTHPGRSR